MSCGEKGIDVITHASSWSSLRVAVGETVSCRRTSLFH
jgi:hypothetical protein